MVIRGLGGLRNGLGEEARKWKGSTGSPHSKRIRRAALESVVDCKGII
jgi:hypothetical protein